MLLPSLYAPHPGVTHTHRALRALLATNQRCWQCGAETASDENQKGLLVKRSRDGKRGEPGGREGMLAPG
jgi:hypothetical protein